MFDTVGIAVSGEQIPLDLCVRARSTDPISSPIAADRMRTTGAADSQRQRVLAGVQRYPGSTSKELAGLIGMDRHAVARRLPELVEVGLVSRTVHRTGCRWWWPR